VRNKRNVAVSVEFVIQTFQLSEKWRTKKLVYKISRIGPAASTNQISPFSYWLCESRIGPDFSYWPCFQELLFSNS